MKTYAATVTGPAYKAMNPNQRARHDFLYELERHYGITVEMVASHIAKIYCDGPGPARAISLLFSASDDRIIIRENIGRAAAAELATFADHKRFRHAVCTLIASAVEL